MEFTYPDEVTEARSRLSKPLKWDGFGVMQEAVTMAADVHNCRDDKQSGLAIRQMADGALVLAGVMETPFGCDVTFMLILD